MSRIINASTARGCAGLAFLAGLACIAAVFGATDTVFQEIACGTLAVASFAAACALLLMVVASYLEK
jgi:hypothetical protein